jgi:cold shock protein
MLIMGAYCAICSNYWHLPLRICHFNIICSAARKISTRIGEKNMNGTVKWFNAKKGYGFATGEDGESYFIHRTQVPEGVMLNDNDPITFDAVETDKGKQAQNLCVGGAGAPAEASVEDEVLVEEESDDEGSTDEESADDEDLTEEKEE